MDATALTLTDEDDGRSLAMPVGTLFWLALKETPTSGYRWQVRVDDPASLAVQDNGYVPAGAGIGGAGQRLWKLQARTCGSCTLRAELRRAWQTAAPPEASFALSLHITPVHGAAGSPC